MFCVSHRTTVIHVHIVCCAFQLTFYHTVGSSRVPCGQRVQDPCPFSTRHPSTLSWFEGRHFCTIVLVPTPQTEFLPVYHPYDTFFVSSNDLSPIPSAQASLLTSCPHLLGIVPGILRAQSVCCIHQSGSRGSGLHTQRHRPGCKRWDPTPGPGLATHTAPLPPSAAR